MGIFLKYFGATYCGPCKAIKPTVENLLSDGRISASICDIDNDTSCMQDYQNLGFRAVPAFALYKDQQLVDSGEGWSSEQLRAAVTRAENAGNSGSNGSGNGSGNADWLFDDDYYGSENTVGESSQGKSIADKLLKYALIVSSSLLLMFLVVFFIKYYKAKKKIG